VSPALCCLCLMLSDLLSVNNLFAARTHYLLSLYTAFSFGNFLPTTFIDNVLKNTIRGPGGAGNFSLHHRVQTASGTHPSLLSSGYQKLFLWGYSGRAVKLTTHLQLVLRSRMRGAILPLPNTFLGVVLS
jgi:hypothetical protein